jgi:hypothetical protein
LPGLNLEAETIDELRNKPPGAIQDLLEGAGKETSRLNSSRLAL